MEQFHATTIVCVRRGNRVALAAMAGHPGQHRHQGHGAQDPPPVPRQDPGRLRRRHRRRLHAAGALRGQARETPGQPDARGGRTHPRLAHRPRAAPPEAMLIVADAEHTLVLTGNGDVLEPSTAGGHRLGRRLCPVGRAGAAAQHRAVTRGRRQAVAGNRRRPVHLHQPEPRHRNAGRMTRARPQRRAAPAPPSPKDPLSCPHPT